MTKISKNKKIIIGLFIIAALAIGGAVYVKSTQPPSTDTATQPEATQSKEEAAASSPNSTGNSATKGTASTASGDNGLAAPTGQLLNKQRIMLGSNDPVTNTSMESICQTLTNASCDIRLTSGSTVKLVGAKSTGGSGSVSFNWDARSVGVTPGTWTVQAVVTQDGKTGISHSETLVVQP